MNADFYILMVLFIYMPFHFFEEAMGDFPSWMYKHWTPFHLSYGHWMANNIFLFYPLLVVSFLIHYFMPQMISFFGGGILVWGIINFGDHAFYTVKDKKISTGLWTGIIYLVNSICGFRALWLENRINVVIVMLSVIMGIFLFMTPIISAKYIGKTFMKRFGMPVEEIDAK